MMFLLSLKFLRIARMWTALREVFIHVTHSLVLKKRGGTEVNFSKVRALCPSVCSDENQLTTFFVVFRFKGNEVIELQIQKNTFSTIES